MVIFRQLAGQVARIAYVLSTGHDLATAVAIEKAIRPTNEQE
jgi:hypothetical protein